MLLSTRNFHVINNKTEWMKQNTMENNIVSDKWKKKFDFYEENGVPGSPGYRKALAKAPFPMRMSLSMNAMAFIFGVVYFCVLGLWKKGLMLLLSFFVLVIVTGILEQIYGEDFEFVYQIIGMTYAVVGATIVDSAYYLKKVKGIDNWNPFENVYKALKSAQKKE